jgi:hypothetical protein
MKSRTNKEKPHLGQTIESIGMMYRSLKELYEDVYPKSPAWFAAMAQGDVSQLRDLLDDVEWLMEDMIPQELRGQAAPLEESDDAEAADAQKAA